MAKKNKQSFGQRMAALRAAKGKKPTAPLMKKKGKKMDAEDLAEIKAGKKPTAAEERAEAKKGKTKSKNFIAGAIKKPGALRATAGVKKGQKIPSGKLDTLANEKGVTGKRARLAQTLESFHKAKPKKVSKEAKAYVKKVGMKAC